MIYFQSMSEHAVKDNNAVKLDYLRQQVGVLDTDLEGLSSRLRPSLPVLLRKLRLDDGHFDSKLFSSDKKLQFLSSVAALASAQQKVEDTNQLGIWSARHSQDPSDKSHYRPIGYRESM